MSDDPRLPRGDRDTDDVQTGLGRDTTAPTPEQLDAVAVALEGLCNALDRIGACEHRATAAHRALDAVRAVRDQALHMAVVTYGENPRQVARDTGIALSDVVLACR